MAQLLYRLGIGSARHPWRVIISWIVILAGAGTAFGLGFSGLATSFNVPGMPSTAVVDELEKELPEYAGAAGQVTFRTEDGQPFTAEQEADIADLAHALTSVENVNQVIDPFTAEAMKAEQADKLTSGETQLAAGREQIARGRAQLEEGQRQLEEGKAQLTQGLDQLNQAIAGATAAGQDETVAGLEAQRAELETQQKALETQQATLDASRAELEKNEATLEAQATALTDGKELLSYAQNVRTVSESGDAAILNVSFSLPLLDLPQSSKDQLIDTVSDHPIPGVEVGISNTIAQGIPALVGTSEIIGVVFAFIVLGVLIQTITGAVIPLATALTGVAVGVLATMAFSGVFEMTSVTPVLGLMLGLAVGIDYSLFIVNRHRHQLMVGADVDESIGVATGTSGNAVVFAGATVIIALLALNVTAIPFLGLMGTVGAVCVFFAVCVAITLVPALLGLAGERVIPARKRAAAATHRAVLQRARGEHTSVLHDAPADGDAPADDDGTADGDGTATAAPLTTAAPEPADQATSRTKTTRAAGPDAQPRKPASKDHAMSWTRAIVTTVVAIAALLTCAIPALSMHVALPSGAQEEPGTYGRTAYDTILDSFGPGENGPLLVTAALPAGLDEASLVSAELEVARAIHDLGNVTAVAPIATSKDGSLLALQVIPGTGPDSAETQELVKQLRGLAPIAGEGDLGVAGEAAMNIDISDRLTGVLPLYIVVVVGLSIIILIVVFRSLLVPLVATGGFVLSLFASYGALVAVFQWGWLSDVFGLHGTGPILNFLPIILVGILFGLAMDYQLFIASGIREAWSHGSDPRVAVMKGLKAGRPVVIAAGLIMVSVFGGFVFADSVMIRSIGFGLAFGVLVDAFVVRLLLMPALMHLLGKASWWLPRWLMRILPDVDVEGSQLEKSHRFV